MGEGGLAPQATIFQGLASHWINLLEILDAWRTAMARFGDDWGPPGSIALKFLGCRWMLQWLPAPLRKKGAPFHGACGFRHSFYHTSWGAPFYARLEL